MTTTTSPNKNILVRNSNGLLSPTKCANVWGSAPLCLITRHYCTYDDPGSVVTINGKPVCGLPFCNSCQMSSSGEGSAFCPYHDPQSQLYQATKASSVGTTNIVPYLSFTDDNGKQKSLPFISSTKKDSDAGSVCKFKKGSKCIYTKKDMKSKIGESKGLFLCNYSSHDKPIHFECFQNLIITECNNKFLTTCSADGKEVAIFVCGKQCYNNYNKAMQNKVKKDKPTATTYWSKDRSEEFLVRWLSDEMNCNKYFGAKDTSNKDKSFGKEDGLTRTGICNQIAAKMKEELDIERGADAIKSKIYDLIAKFKIASDRCANTGEGILATDGETSFREFMLQIFQWYYDLLPVLGNRPSIRPFITTDEGFDTSSSSDDDDDDDDSDDDDNSDGSKMNTPGSTPSASSTNCNSTTVTATSASGNKKRRNHNKSKAPTVVKEPAMAVRKKMKDIRGSTPTGNTYNFGGGSADRELKMNAMMDGRFEYYKTKSEVEKKHSDIEQRRFEIEEPALRAEAMLKSIVSRKKAQETDPTLSTEMLDMMFPATSAPTRTVSSTPRSAPASTVSSTPSVASTLTVSTPTNVAPTSTPAPK